MAGGGMAVAGQDPVSVRFRALSSSGEGVGELPDGRVVFVPFTAPEDRATIEVVRSKRSWARGRVLRLQEESPDRVRPACPYFGRCGGCSLQHLRYEAQVAWKGRFIADALARIGGLQTAPPEVVAAPEPFGYRNRMTFTLRRLRGGAVVAGLHEHGRPGRILDVDERCLLPEAPVRRAWAALRAAWGPGAALLPPGGQLRLTLRAVSPAPAPEDTSGGDDGVFLTVEGGAAGWDARPLARACPEALHAVWHRPRGADGAPTLVYGAPEPERWEDDTLPPTGRAFHQVNRAVTELLRQHVLDELEGARTVIDAYAGTGRYARALARRGARVVAVEVDEEACAAARTGAPEGLSVICAPAEDALAAPELGGLRAADAVVVNPPRGGLTAEVPPLLRRWASRRLVYVSCDPATLARDLKRLGPHFEPVRIQGFDLFPQTPHVETVVTLERVAMQEADR